MNRDGTPQTERQIAAFRARRFNRLETIELACPGVWRETYEDGSVLMVADMTSALWTFRRDGKKEITN